MKSSRTVISVFARPRKDPGRDVRLLCQGGSHIFKGREGRLQAFHSTVSVEKQVAVAEQLLGSPAIDYGHRVPDAWQREGNPCTEVRLDAARDDIDARPLGG